jgi:hypothetical protein
MNGNCDEVEGHTEEVADAAGDAGPPRRERKVAQVPGRSAGKVKQMVASFNEDEFDEDEDWGRASDA